MQLMRKQQMPVVALTAWQELLPSMMSMMDEEGRMEEGRGTPLERTDVRKAKVLCMAVQAQ